MSTSALISKSTVFKRGDGASSETFTAIAEMNSIGLPEESRNMIDVTDLSSTAKEFVPGLLDSGQVRINMNFTRDTYLDMRTDLLSDSSVNYQIVFDDAGNTTIDFAGYVMSIGGNAPGPDEKVAMDVTFKVTGSLTVSS